MTDDWSGPALKGSLYRWNKDSIQLQTYFSDSQYYLDTTSDSRLISLREKWKPMFSHKYKFSIQEVKDVMSYVDGI